MKNFHILRIKEDDSDDEGDNIAALMQKVYAVNICEQDASNQLIQLNTHYPLPPSLHHVKRIWRRTKRRVVEGEEKTENEIEKECSFVELSLILGPIDSDLTREEWQKKCSELEIRLVDEVRVTKVPTRMPKSRSEYEEWRQREYWPTVFHEDKMRLAREEEELALIQRLSQVVIDLLKSDNYDYALLMNPTTASIEAEYWSATQGDIKSILDDPVMQVISQMAANQLDTRKRTLESAYLCTGLVLFCGKEPSLMTAMAMVHSRIRAIVFVDRDEERGSLVSRLKLHSFPSLNHHFSVYQLIVEDCK